MDGRQPRRSRPTGRVGDRRRVSFAGGPGARRGRTAGARRQVCTFVLALGAHADLPRVMRYLCTGVRPTALDGRRTTTAWPCMLLACRRPARAARAGGAARDAHRSRILDASSDESPTDAATGGCSQTRARSRGHAAGAGAHADARRRTHAMSRRSARVLRRSSTSSAATRRCHPSDRRPRACRCSCCTARRQRHPVGRRPRRWPRILARSGQRARASWLLTPLLDARRTAAETRVSARRRRGGSM